MFKINFLKIFLAASWLVFSCVFAWAQNIQFTAEIDSRQVPLGSSAQLTLTVTGTQDVPDIEAPAVEGLDIQFLGPSTQITIVNGQYSSSKSLMYSVVPLRTGHFTIPSITAAINGQNYSTDPVEIDVTNAPASNAITPSQPLDNAASLEDRVYLVLQLSKDKVYVNERLPIKIFLLVADLAISDVHMPQLTQLGIDIEKFGQPLQYEKVINGIRYNVVEFNTNIYPTRTGELTIGPARLDCNMVIKSSSRRRAPFGGGMFDDDFFNSFFDNFEKRPLALQSKASILTVSPLPEENKPADFSGAVGQFNMDVTVGPNEVNVGDPVTVKMNIGGEGNFNAVVPPAFIKADNFKVYDPQIKEEGGFKKLEQVLIPESDKVTEIPTVKFFYFDPSLGQYQIISKGPFLITVYPSKNEPVQTSAQIGTTFEPAQPLTPLGQDIVFIKETSGEFYVIGKRFYHTFVFYLFVLVILGCWGILYVNYCRKYRIATDIVYARRLLAPKEAKRGLQEAKRAQNLEDPSKFYDALFGALQKYLGHKLHLSAGAVTLDVVEAKLKGRVDEKWLGQMREAFSESDAIRFASLKVNLENRAQSYTRVEQIIDALERLKI